MRHAIGIAVALAGVALGQVRGPGPDETVLVVLEGRLGPPPDERTAGATLQLDVKGERRAFQVERARVLRGERFGPDVVDEVSPFRPSLYLRGPDGLLMQIERAGPADRLAITGYYRSGSRNFLVSAVHVVDAAREHDGRPRGGR